MDDDAGGVDDTRQRRPLRGLDPRRHVAGEPAERRLERRPARRRQPPRSSSRASAAARAARRGARALPPAPAISGRCSAWSTDGSRAAGRPRRSGASERLYTLAGEPSPRPDAGGAWYPARLWVGSARRTSRTACLRVVPKEEKDISHLSDEMADLLYPGRRPRPFRMGVAFEAFDGPAYERRWPSRGARPSTGRSRGRGPDAPRRLRRGRGAPAARPVRAGQGPPGHRGARRREDAPPTRTSCGCRSSGSSSAARPSAWLSRRTSTGSTRRCASCR